MNISVCPICGKKPKIKRDYVYESMSYGAWCIIQCKPLFHKQHLKAESGKSTWERAYKEAVSRWNYYVNQELEKHNG